MIRTRLLDLMKTVRQSHSPSALARRAAPTRRPMLWLEPLEDRLAPAIGVYNGFQGLNQLQAGGGVPDTNLAVGPGEVIEALNTELGFYNKTTGALGDHPSLFNFFGDANGGFSLTRELFTTTWRPASWFPPCKSTMLRTNRLYGLRFP